MNKILAIIVIITLFTACNRKWNESDRKKFIADCVKQAKGTVLQDRADSYCSCMQPVMEKRYPTIKEANQVKESEMQSPEMQKAALKCLGGGTGAGTDDNTNDDNGNTNNTDDDNQVAGNWTTKQRQSFIDECAQSYQTGNNTTAATAKSYCSCMTDKIQDKMTYSEASKLSSADLSTAEWQKEILDCTKQNN